MFLRDIHFIKKNNKTIQIQIASTKQIGERNTKSKSSRRIASCSHFAFNNIAVTNIDFIGI